MTPTDPGQSLELQDIRKHYGAVTALDGLSLEVRAGEFVALLGPSGSGKTTALMAIAGFERPDGGRIVIGGQAIDGLPPHRRNIGMVFQRYALFPHLTVAENVAYPLRRRGLPTAEIAARVAQALALVRLDGLGPRGTDQLSGGQQQRVAIARALVFRPGVLLMDEPMSALDKKLRQHMQMELRLLHRELGCTIVLVTHDQEEALSMADRVAPLSEGRLRQFDAPAALYENPADAFVADFIGRTNFLPLDGSGDARIAGFAAPLGVDALAADSPPALAGRVFGIRPEHVALRTADHAGGEPCRVVEAAYAGATQSVLVEAAGHRILAEVPSSLRLWSGGDAARLDFHARRGRIFLPLSSP